MDGENKLKKRGRDIEEESYSSGTPTAKKQETCYHNNNNNNNTNEDDLSRREELEVHNLKVFDFPWLHEEEGMMCESENLFNLEDTFSSTLNHPTHCSITIAGPGADVPQFEFSADTFSAAFVPSALDDKFEMWPLDAVGDHDALQTDGADCIWAPLLNQPLQHTLSS